MSPKKHQGLERKLEGSLDKDSVIETPRSAESIGQEKEVLPAVEREELARELLADQESDAKSLAKKSIGSNEADTPIAPAKSPVLVEIENILEQDLGDAFFQMDPVSRTKFKAKGEEVAFRIEAILKSSKVKAGNIFKLIMEWLKMIPGVNKFFLRQEAKIKVDKILSINEKNKL